MKNKFFAIILLGGVAILSGFEKIETATGSITVNVLLDGTPSKGALVGVATSEENRENSVYLHEKETDANGVIKFTAIPAGNYYIDAFNEDFYGEAEVVVAADNVTITIALMEDEDDQEEED